MPHALPTLYICGCGTTGVSSLFRRDRIGVFLPRDKWLTCPRDELRFFADPLPGLR